LRDFAARFGELEINVASGPYQEPGIPEVMTLSNIVENGKPIGLADAGQDWHTDMSYSKTIAFANVLYGIKIPRRNGKVLGNTEAGRRASPKWGGPALQVLIVHHLANSPYEDCSVRSKPAMRYLEGVSPGERFHTVRQLRRFRHACTVH
jgi:alpha-ketoglutarate-dependent taurine dioxygenase